MTRIGWTSCAVIFIRVWALLCLLLAPATTLAQQACPDFGKPAPFVTGGAALTPAGDHLALAVSGSMRFASAANRRQVREGGANLLCRSILGKMAIEVRGPDGRSQRQQLCADFDGSFFKAGEQLQIRDSGLSFAISRSIATDGLGILIYVDPQSARCANQIVFSVLGQGTGKLVLAQPTPDRFTEHQASWTSEGLAWAAERGVSLNVLPELSAQGSLSMKEPRSWFRAGSSSLAASLERIGGIALFMLVLAGVFKAIGRAGTSMAATDPWLPVSSRLAGLALTMVLSGRLLEAAFHFGPILLGLHTGPRPEDQLGQRLFHVANGLWPSQYVGDAIYLGLPVAVSLAASVVSGAVLLGANLRRRRIPRYPMEPPPALDIVFRASASALAVSVFSFLTFLAERFFPIGFEAPALCVSMGIAFALLLSLRPVWSGTTWWMAPVAVGLAASLLFPYDPVFRSSFNPSVARNTLAWAQFIMIVLARPILASSFLLQARAWARIHPPAGREGAVDRILLALFLLASADSALSSPTSATAVLLVWFLAQYLLFAPAPQPQPAARRRGAPKVDLGRVSETEAVGRANAIGFICGVTALSIFWLQYALQPPDVSGRILVFLSTISMMFSYFVTAALGGTLLSHAFNRLRGDSAAMKATLLCAALLAVSIASRVLQVFTSHSPAPAIMDVISVVAALMAVAVFAFDVPHAQHRARAAADGNLFKGTSLGGLVGILSALVAAAVSALSPVIPGLLKERFSSYLTQSLEQPQSPQKPTSEGGPPPPAPTSTGKS